jgi:adenosylmethionine-8-amino-7-oxononanoate aminotransferase
MSGGGRTGRFFAAEHWGTAPDMLVVAKGFGAGYVPLGALIAKGSIVEAVLDAGGFVHGFTYAGNPLACAAGVAVIEVIERDGLISNAARIGALLKARLEALIERYPFIGDVRGLGLLLAFELVADRTSMQPLSRELRAFERLVEIAHDEGLILYARRTRGGSVGDHFMVCPPMIAREEHVDEIIAALDRTLAQFALEARLPAATGAGMAV